MSERKTDLQGLGELKTPSTATPWRVRIEDGPPYTDIMIGDRLLATCYPEHYKSRSSGLGHPSDRILHSYREAEANARLIVRAVNNHDRLIAALRTMVDAYYEYGSGDDSQPEAILGALAAIQEAGDGRSHQSVPSIDQQILDLYRTALNRIVRYTPDGNATDIAERVLTTANALRQGKRL